MEVKIPIKSSVASMLVKAKHIALSAGGSFSGNEVCGSFTASGVQGEYVVWSTEVVVTIHKKPRFAPWSMVTMKIRDAFK